MPYTVAVDSGGTFSDCCVISADGQYWTGKAASTPPDFETGVVDAVADAARQMDMSLEALLAECALFAHGTTVSTNALLTRDGCRTALITTAGHEDALLIGRVHSKVAGLSSWQVRDLSRLEKPEPIIPRRRIHGLVERMDCFGQTVVPLNQESLEAIADAIEADGAEAVAISLLWSFKNDAHEKAVRDYLLQRNPDLFVCLSSELAPIMGEYERTATTAINAYLSRRTRDYMSRLRGRLGESGFTGKAVVMQSSGGIMAMEKAQERAVSLLASGPAGGVIGALTVEAGSKGRNLITSDVGGTSFDVGLIINGEPELAEAPVFGQYHIAFPMIDIQSIGAGGGSIAWIQEETGLLKVGPQSAGSRPGPACYGRGGTQPTVTDANLILGRLNPDYFLGGTATLDLDAARQALQPLAETLGMSLEQAALGIVEIADAQMGDLVRKVTIQKGHDPRKFTLFSFGGAGPLQVCGYCRGTGIEEIVVPAVSSVFSAFGIAQADLLSVAEASCPLPLPCAPEALEQVLGQLTERARADLALPPGVEAKVSIVRELALRYSGQNYAVSVEAPDSITSEADVEALIAAFEEKYERLYGEGTAYRAAGIQATVARVRATASLGLPRFSRVPPPAGSKPEVSPRQVYFREFDGWRETPFYRLDSLPADFAAVGPFFVESPHTTIYVAPDYNARIDGTGNLVLSPLAGASESVLPATAAATAPA